MRTNRPESGWFNCNDTLQGHTLGETIFLLKDNGFSNHELRKDTQRLRDTGTGQLRWANDRIEYFSHIENDWHKSGVTQKAFENSCPPLADLNWPPQTQEGNDVDSW